MAISNQANQTDSLIHYLTRFITPERKNKLRDILLNRTKYVTVVLEDLYQTQNISAVLRSCECYGVQDVHIIENNNEFMIHPAISMGSDKWLSLHHYENSANNVGRCVQTLKKKGYQIVATALAPNTISLYDLPINQPMAFCFGTELTGLTDECIQYADYHVTIPMYGFTESFNISNAVAITLSYMIEKIRSENIQWQLTEQEHKELYLEWLKKSIKDAEMIIEKFLFQ